MPIHEFLLPDGRKQECLFMPGEEVPKGLPLEHEGVEVWCPRVASAAVVKFKGAFSGGTASKHIVHKDDGSIIEPGRKQDVLRNKAERQRKEKESRQRHIEKSLATYDV